MQLARLLGSNIPPRESGRRALAIRWGFAASPVGICSLGWCSCGACHLAFHDSREPTEVLPELRRRWPQADFVRDDAGARSLARDVFEECPSRRSGRLRVFLKGTDFQRAVWRVLRDIPPGSVRGYGDIAAIVGRPGAARAVGAACGANPVAVLVPCHRVVHANGDPRGYHWGDARKAALLERERTAVARQKPDL